MFGGPSSPSQELTERASRANLQVSLKCGSHPLDLRLRDLVEVNFVSGALNSTLGALNSAKLHFGS